MGFFEKLFNTQKEDKQDTQNEGIPWQLLDCEDQFKNLIVNSKILPKVIFKHSTRCGISRMVLRNFEKDYQLQPEDADFYLLDLLNYRDLSNTISQELQVMHQSPQVIVLKDQKVIHTDSHHGISMKFIQDLITK